MATALSLALIGCSSDNTSTNEGNGETTEEVKETTASTGGKLEQIVNRGHIVVGTNNELPGFGFVDSNGEYTGFDVDFGKAMAVAILGDPDAVEFRPLSSQERFAAVQTGEVDMLIRNSTWTLSRDADLGLAFGPTTFYDGQGMMVTQASGIKTLEDLRGARIGVEQGTTTELNLTDQMRQRGIDFEAVVFADQDSLIAAYESGTVDAWTTDKSGLNSRMIYMADPEGHYILPDTLSKEPLGPLVLDGDHKFFDVMQWVVFATIQAEEFGITSQNIDEFLDSEDPAIQRFLGVDGNLGEGLGLSNDFAYQVVKQMGNYGEIYARHLGTESAFGLERGMNALYTEGGLMYSPPFR